MVPSFSLHERGVAASRQRRTANYPSRSDVPRCARIGFHRALLSDRAEHIPEVRHGGGMRRFPNSRLTHHAAGRTCFIIIVQPSTPLYTSAAAARTNGRSTRAPRAGARPARTLTAPVRRDSRCSTPRVCSCRTPGYPASPDAEDSGADLRRMDHSPHPPPPPPCRKCRPCRPGWSSRAFSTAGRNAARTSDAPRRLGSIVRVNQDGSPPRK